MADREKLIDLLVKGCNFHNPCPGVDCFVCIADHLSNSGVLVQEWIPVTERLPSRDSTVLAFYETMRGTSAAIQVTKGWNLCGTATHWMPLPAPPKEVE